MARYDKNRAPRKVQKNQESKSHFADTIPPQDASNDEQIQLADGIETNIEIVSDSIPRFPTMIHWIPGSGESAGQQFHIQIEEHALEVCTCSRIIFVLFSSTKLRKSNEKFLAGFGRRSHDAAVVIYRRS